MARAKPFVFRTVDAEYTSAHIIGAGGGGTVYAAIDADSQPVAVKVLDASRSTRRRLKRFANEYRFGIQNQHPHLVRVLGHGVLERAGEFSPFFVMPRYKGSLRDLMKQGVPPEKALEVFSRILSGVEAAHLKKVVHRDLKPENILANDFTDLAVADFGIARFGEEELYTAIETRDNERLANFMYAAPEQRAKGVPVDSRADIFALGLMLNELFTGAVPHGVGYKTVAGSTPNHAWIDSVVMRLIQAQPSERPDSIAAVRELLQLHSNLFEDRQKLSALSGAVVSASEPDDISAVEEPKVTSARYEAGDLVITLSHPVSSGWINAFRAPATRSARVGAEPEKFGFRGNEARVPLRDQDEGDVPQILEFFKSWLPNATHKYRETLQRERRKQEEAKRAELDRQRKEIERAIRINSALGL